MSPSPPFATLPDPSNPWNEDRPVDVAQPWPRHVVRFRILAREPEQRPWSIMDLIRGLQDVGRVHETGFVTRISRPAHPGWQSGLIAVDFYAPVGWAPQPDPSLDVDQPYYAGGPGTRTWEGSDVP